VRNAEHPGDSPPLIILTGFKRSCLAQAGGSSICAVFPFPSGQIDRWTFFGCLIWAWIKNNPVWMRLAVVSRMQSKRGLGSSHARVVALRDEIPPTSSEYIHTSGALVIDNGYLSFNPSPCPPTLSLHPHSHHHHRHYHHRLVLPIAIPQVRNNTERTR
jgi:hypothetical protein